MTGWAKRVTWRCPKPSDTPVDWLGRTIQEQMRFEQAAYWQRVRHEAAQALNEWLFEPLEEPRVVPSAHDDGETTIGAAGGEQSAGSGPESGPDTA